MTRHWFRKKDGRSRSAGTLFDDAVVMLEERVMLDATPVVTVDAPTNALLTNPGASVNVTLTFDNTGADAGYGPFIELIVPKNGADGADATVPDATNDDGLTFNGATYLGQPVTVVGGMPISFTDHDNNPGTPAQAINPLTGDVVTGAIGDQLVVLQLPFGSYTGAQTPAAIIANFSLSPFADLGTPLTLTARSGFQFGADPLDNPGVDMPIPQMGTSSDTVTPTLATISKVAGVKFDKEAEIATGPNNPGTYTVAVDVANGQTLTNVTITDSLPDRVVITSITTSGTIVTQPTLNTTTGPGNDSLVVNFASVTGTNATNDATVTLAFYVPDNRFAGMPVIDPTTGAITTTFNTASLTATWQPLDVRDALTTFTPAPATATFQNQPIVIQKSATIVNDTGPAGLNPGDVVEYVLDIQISDYFTLGSLQLTDLLSDGQRLDTSMAATPTYTVIERGTTIASGNLNGTMVGGVAAGDVTTGNEFTGTFSSSFSAVTGVTTSTINISAALVAAGANSFLGTAGVVSGGRIGGPDAAGTTIQVRFRAIVQNSFESDTLNAANQAVDQGDAIGNDVSLFASIHSNTDATEINGSMLRDDAAETLTIARGGVVKSIYAINGLDPAGFVVNGQLQLKAGDLITYRLEYVLPITSFQSLTFADFLPLPVLVARDITFTTPATPATAPGENLYSYGPTDTLNTRPGVIGPPTDSFDAGGNSITFTYADYSLQNQGQTNVASKIDILFTLRAQDTNFADGLFLTNLATSSESNTAGNATSGNGIVQIQLAQPKLTIQKAIVSASSGTITTPETVNGLTFNAPGSATGYTLAGGVTLSDMGVAGNGNLGLTMNRDTVAATNINSNVTGLDAGDTARVALIINNEGGDDAFDVVFGDTLAAGTVFAGAGGLVEGAGGFLQVTRGDGTLLMLGVDYTVTTSTATGFQITLTNNFGANNAGIGADGVTDGSDILLVTYDIALANTVVIAPAALTSNANVPTFRAIATTGVNLSTNPVEAATIGLGAPAVIKAVVAGTSTSAATAIDTQLTIGEETSYTVTYTFPEGTLTNVRLSDLLPNSGGLGRYELVSATVTSVGANLQQAAGGMDITAGSIGAAVITDRNADGILDTATFGGAGGFTVVNEFNNAGPAADDRIVVTVVVRAVDNAANVNGANGVNTGRLTYGAADTVVNANAPISIALPDLNIDKVLTTPVGAIDAGDTVTFTITVNHVNGTIDAYDVNISDPLPAGLSNLMVTAVNDGGAFGLTTGSFSTAGNVLSLVTPIATMSGTQSFTVTITATVDNNVPAGSTLVNNSSVTYSTLSAVVAGERTTTETDPANVPIAPTGVAKTIFTTSVGGDASATVVIGETVTFDLLATLSEGDTNNFMITDTLPAGLVFVSGTVVSIGGNTTGGATAGGNITGSALAVGAVVGTPAFSFGTLNDTVNNTAQTAADQILVRVTARVADIMSNVRGTMLVNTGIASSTVGGMTVSQSSTSTVTVALPDLVIDKARVGAGTPDAGDTVTFTIDVRHAAGSNTAAFDLALADALPAGLTNLAVTGVTTNIAGLTTGNFGTAGNTLSLTGGPFSMATNEFFTVTITAVIADSAATNTAITNTAGIGFSTISGNVAGERTILPTDPAHQDSAGLTTAGAQTIVKTITGTSVGATGAAQGGGGPDLVVGETGNFQIVVTLPEGTTNAVTIADILQNALGRLTLQGVPTVTLGNGITFTGTGAFAAGADGNGDGLPDGFSFNFGNVTVPGDNLANNTITITYTALLTDVVQNAAGNQPSPTATLTSALGTPTSTTPYDIVQPNVTITKVVNNLTTAPSGDIVTYTATLVNTAGSTADAQDVVFTDLLGNGATFVGGTVLVNGVATAVTPSGSGFTVQLPSLALGATTTVVYQANITAAAQATVTNTAQVDYDGIASGGVPAADGQGDCDQTRTANASLGTVSITKAITTTSVADTGAGQVRAGVQDLVIGETATFQLTVNVPAGGRTLTVTDLLDLAGVGQLTIVSGPMIGSSAGVVIDTQTITMPQLNGFGSNDLQVVFVTGAGSTAGTITITYTAVAANVADNAAGDQINLAANLNYATPAAGFIAGNIGATAGADIIEPSLTIDKTVMTVGTPNAGDAVTYTIVVTNAAGANVASASDVTITDPLPAGMTYVPGTATLTLSMGGGMTNPADPTAVTIPTLLAGQTATLTFSARIGDTIVTGATVTNTATLGSDSLPGAPVGRPGPTPNDPASFTTQATQAFAKRITVAGTDNADTTDTGFRAGIADLGIGEQATVDLRIDLSEGATQNVTISDFLTSVAGTLTFVPGSAVLSVPNGVTFTGSIVPTLIDDNADGVPDRAVFNLGTVTVPGDNAGGNNFLVLSYQAIAANRAENIAGDALDLNATLTTALGTLNDDASVDIVEPVLTIDKSVATGGAPDAGDTVTYTIVVTNTGTGPAYGVTIGDPLPANLAYTGTPSLTVGGVTTNPAFAGSLTVPVLLPGQTATLTYQAVVGAGAATGATITNTATVDSDALPGAPVGRATPTVSDPASFATDAAQVFAKTIFTTDNADTGSAAVNGANPDLAIGETATFDLRIDLSEGSTASVSVSDFLTTAAGILTYVPGSASVVTANGVTFTGSIVPALVDDNGDGVPDRVVFNLGTVTVPGDNAGGNNFFVIRYQAVAADLPANQSGDQLDLTATLTTALGTLNGTRSVDIVGALLAIDKSIMTSDATPNAGDTVTYTIVVTNNGVGPSYGVTITDPLPAGLTYTGTPTLTLSIGGAQPTPGNPASVAVARLLPGESATLSYQAIIGNNAVTGTPIFNTATVTASGTTPGGGGRAGPNPSDSANFTVEALQGLDKAITATTDPNTTTGAFRPVVTDLGIGEIATIDLTVRLTEGSTGAVVVTDKLQLPAGTLTLIGAPTIVTANGVAFTGAGAAGYTLTDTDADGAPDTITMDFGTVTVPGNNDPSDNFFVIRYTAQVSNRPENQVGDQIDLTATLTTALGLTSMATALGDVVAPQLVLTKAAMAGFVSRGDTVGYTISLMNNGTGPAYDQTLADVLPAGLGYVAGSTTLTVGGVTTAFASPNAVTLATLGAGQTATVNYQVLVDPAAAAAAAYTNTASVAFDSVSGPGGRTGTADGTATITTPTNVLGLSKAIINTSIPETGTAMFRPGNTDLNVGERAFIDLTASFTEGNTATVVLTDQLPLGAKFQLVGTPVITFLGGITTTLPGTPTLVDTDGDGLADRLTFSFGTVTVPVDGDPTNNLIRIRYEVVVPDLAVNTPGSVLDSPAILTSAVGNASAGTFADIVAPNVGITKIVSATPADAGDAKAYTVTLTNNGTGPAFDLTIADALPTGLTLVAGTTVLTVGGVSTQFASPAAVPIASLGVGQSAVLTFSATIDNSVVGGTTLTNSATVSYDSLSGPGGRAASATGTAAFATAAVQTLDKAVVATSEAFTGVQYVRPATTDLTIGERATFELTTTFSEGTTNNVVITDQLVTVNGVLTFTGTPVLVLPNGATITGSVTPQFVDTNGDGVPDQVRFVLGNVTIPGDNDPTNNVIRIRYDAVLANTAANVAGNQVALPATLTSSSGSLTDSEPLDIVAPVLTLAKTLAPAQPSDGQTTVFLITIGHAAGSTAAATNIVLTEMLPPGALLAGVSVVGGPAGITINGNVIRIPLLGVGETVTIQVSTGVDFASPPSGDTINTASLGFGTVTAGTPGGRIVTGVTASATLPFGNPTTSLPGMRDAQERNELSSIGHYLDYRYVEDFPDIDPVYSGSAAPGTFVTIDVSDETGSSSGLGTGIADAGGNWLVRLPSTTVSDRLERSRFDTHYDGARLFRSPNGELFDDRSLLGFERLGDRLSVGSKPAYNTQIVRIHTAGQGAGFGASFAPAWRDQFFSMEPGLSVEGVFRGRASEAVEGLLEGLEAPEDAGLNRFNREFLSTADF